MELNNALVVTVNHESFEANGDVQIDYDEKLLTAKEAEEMTNRFLSEAIELMKKAN